MLKRVLMSVCIVIPNLVFSQSAVADHGSGSHINLGLDGPAYSDTGNFTISWNNYSDPSVDHYESLQEKSGSGGYVTIYSGTSGNVPINGRSSGEYSYRVKREMCFGFFCDVQYTSPIVVIVDTASTADTFSEQLNYEYQIRSGDFNNDGHIDILLDRLTQGPVDGSMQTVIVNGGSIPSVVVPSNAQASHARSFPTNSDIQASGTDGNFDGWADIVLAGLETLGGSYAEDSLILYASGITGQSAPAGLNIMDQLYKDFFHSIAAGLADPNLLPRIAM